MATSVYFNNFSHIVDKDVQPCLSELLNPFISEVAANISELDGIFFISINGGLSQEVFLSVDIENRFLPFWVIV
jgi:hypothetical protein